MLKPALQEKLHKQSLELDLRLQSGELFLCLIRLDRCQDLGQPGRVWLHGKVAGELLFLGPLLGRILVLRWRHTLQLSPLRSDTRVPLIHLSLLLQCFIRLGQTLACILRTPNTVNSVSQRITKPRIDIKVRSPR